MDYAYMVKSSLSMLFFAPGVFLLAVCIFIGLLLMIEKALTSAEEPAVASKTEETTVTAAVNPSPGRLVSELATSLEPKDQTEGGEKKERAAG